MLVVDDEPNIVDVVTMALRHHGFEVDAAETGAGALARVRDWRPDVLVLDVMLPDMDGFEVAKRLGSQHVTVPILFLTARDAISDKLRGLTMGGGDYVTKPFSLEELIARVRNILRHTGALQDQSGRLAFADLELIEDTREVSRGGRPIELTATEYRLLRYLMLNPRRVLVPRATARPCVELRLLRRCAGARDVHELSAQEGGRRRGAAAPHRAGRWLRAAPAEGVSGCLCVRDSWPASSS